MKTILKISSLLFLLCNIANTQTNNWTWKNPLPQGNTLDQIYFLSAEKGFISGSAGTILYTEDGGKNFTILPLDISVGYNEGFYFTHPDTGFFITRNGNIMKSYDGGLNWFELSRTPDVSLRCCDFPTDHIFYCAGSDGAILKSTDSGKNWIHLESDTDTKLYGISFSNADTGWVAGERGVILKTCDGGQTWQKQNSNIDYGLREIVAINSESAIAGGYSHMIRTVDGGENWISYNDFDDVRSISFSSPDTAVAVNADGSIFHTYDRGRTWHETTYLPLTKLLAVDMVSSNIGYVAGYYGTLWKTTDGGFTWSNLNKGVYGRNRKTTLSFVDDSIGYAFAQPNILFKSEDNGENWNQITINTDVHFGNVFFTSIDTGFIAGINEFVWTKDGGDTWENVLDKSTDNIGTFNGITFSNKTDGYAVGVVGGYPNFQAILALTKDGGETWHDTSFTDIRAFRSVKFVNENVGFICGDSGIFMSSRDGGYSWEKLETNCENDLYDLHFFDESAGFVIGYNGILLYTSDGGNSWTKTVFEEGYHFNKIEFVSRSVGFAAGKKGILIKTTDGGKNWSLESIHLSKEIFDIEVVEQRDGMAKVFLSSEDFNILACEDLISTAVEPFSKEVNPVPLNCTLENNYPNPFNPTTTINFNLPEAGNVTLKIYDIQGREVVTLVNEKKTVGQYSIVWNGNDQTGLRTASGMYFYKLQFKDKVITNKMVLMR